MEELSKMITLEAFHSERRYYEYDGGQKCSSKDAEDKTEKTLNGIVAKKIKNYLNIGNCPAPGTIL